MQRKPKFQGRPSQSAAHVGASFPTTVSPDGYTSIRRTTCRGGRWAGFQPQNTPDPKGQPWTIHLDIWSQQPAFCVYLASTGLLRQASSVIPLAAASRLQADGHTPGGHVFFPTRRHGQSSVQGVARARQTLQQRTGCLVAGRMAREQSPTFAKYSSYEPLANCGIVESWLVTAEERKRAAKMARKNRKFSLVKDPDQLW
ncbi:hypothetical protein X797_011971 [Metarhizium robertsii]|uniref:Uncharacterized protein n=2 Tax=Metarhizium robertsii TaxID=568076 RepID=E9FCI0_METRA|nr:uncharacterized protein MAA_09979 [Metarhizium robertsii ARSEF 23]EFY94546.1 hypothetical protein MAA_09979 [Metarhizium robertsii ARSEF 23]EXU94941.1 hypothetical protein X797_011971 [Metarhizium robertsii]